MENRSLYFTFLLVNFEPMDQQRTLCFVIFLLVYILTIVLNALLFTVICVNKTLHEPMYIFLCNLTVNGIYRSTAILPHMMHQLSHQAYRISLSGCLMQIYSLHTFGIVELMILATMGYDRYVAICFPLYYHNKMFPLKVKGLIAFAWLFPLCSFAMYLSMTIRLSFCGKIIQKTHCTNFDLVRLSCFDTSIHNAVGILLIGVFMLPQFLVILFSYIQILRVCIHASKDCQRKALQTCVPHLLVVINYFFGCCFEFIQVRISAQRTPQWLAVFMSLYFLILSPLLNPVIYGSSILKLHIYRLCRRCKLSPK